MFYIRGGQNCWVAEFFVENQKHQRAAENQKHHQFLVSIQIQFAKEKEVLQKMFYIKKEKK